MNELETTVLRLIGENVSDPDVFINTDDGLAQIRGSLNDAIQELSAAKSNYARTYHLPLFTGRQWYRLNPATDWIAYPVLVWDRTNKRKLTMTSLSTLDKQDPFWMQTTGSPLQYMMVGDYFGLYRRPSSKGIVLELKCVCIPAPYSSDRPPIRLRQENQRAAVALAVSEFYASRGDAKRASDYLNKYLETAQLMALNPVQADRDFQFRPKVEANG